VCAHARSFCKTKPIPADPAASGITVYELRSVTPVPGRGSPINGPCSSPEAPNGEKRLEEGPRGTARLFGDITVETVRNPQHGP
jgi:hypothetical protein